MQTPWMKFTFPSPEFPQYVKRTNVQREDLIARIQQNNPPHVARFGDGEILCCLGWEQRNNCDGHPYTPSLAEALGKSVKVFTQTPDLWLGNWFWWPLGVWIHGLTDAHGGQQAWCPHNIFMHVRDLPLEPLRDLYLAVRECSRRKVLVGPDHVMKAIPFLRADDRVVVPLKDGWSHYGTVVDKVLRAVQPLDLVLLAWGMPAKPLMADIIQECPDARCFDIGSGLDPLVNKKSRFKQPDYETLRNVYGDILDG